jgi:hypothetical protein
VLTRREGGLGGANGIGLQPGRGISYDLSGWPKKPARLASAVPCAWQGVRAGREGAHRAQVAKRAGRL